MIHHEEIGTKNHVENFIYLNFMDGSLFGSRAESKQCSFVIIMRNVELNIKSMIPTKSSGFFMQIKKFKAYFRITVFF